MKTNKKYPSTKKMRDKLKFLYFEENKSISYLSIYYGYNKHYLKKWFLSKGLKNYITSTGDHMRKCNSCGLYKKINNFSKYKSKNRGIIYRIDCKYCYSIIKRNTRIMRIANEGDSYRKLERKYANKKGRFGFRIGDIRKKLLIKIKNIGLLNKNK